MRILTFDELTPEMERSRLLVNVAAFGTFVSRERVADLRRRNAIADYVGVFAVDGVQVLGHVFVELIPYDFPEGPGTLSGIATVGTRPDVARSGVARRLLQAAHEHERAAGRRFGALWTNRSWGSHSLYEKLGYRDIYSSPWAVHLPSHHRPAAANVRFATKDDLDEIDRLHDRLAVGRIGHCRRPAGTMRSAVRFRYVDPGSDLLVVRRRGELVGYAHLERSARRVICGEIVAVSSLVKKELIAAVARVSTGLPYAFQHSLVTDDPGMFRGPNFVNGPVGWYGMMGADLGREWSTSAAEERFGTRDPRFICLSGDRF
jgi:predicted N-acetyltransferase YhbS